MTRFMLLSVALVIAMVQVAAAAPVVVNPGFEAPDISGFGSLVAYTPPQRNELDPATIPGWVLGASQGGLPDGTYQGIWNFVGDTTFAPLTGAGGSQVGFFAVKGGFYQDIAGFNANTATVSFLAAGRPAADGPDQFKVTLDGTTLTFGGVGSILPVDAKMVSYTSDPITVTAGTHRLAFTGMGSADNTSFIDNVTINQVPEPTTIMLMATGILGLMAYAWRRHK
jgi:hypothetical protein